MSMVRSKVQQEADMLLQNFLFLWFLGKGLDMDGESYLSFFLESCVTTVYTELYKSIPA